MIRWKLLFVLEIFVISACGGHSTEPPAVAVGQATATADATVATEVIQEPVLPAESRNPPAYSQAVEKPTEILPLTTWRSWAPLCEGHPSKGNCDDGDATLFSGLLCLAGEDQGCRAVKAAQDTTGKFWRSPRRVGVEASNSFSRDMALGVLAYLVATKDTDAAQSWLQWIDQNSVCQIKLGTVCQLKTWRYCREDSDARCLITPGMWSMMRRVWEYLGLPLHKEMRTTGENTLVAEAGQAPLGYALHLKAVIFFLYQKIGKNLPFEWDLIHTIAERQPDNLFFQYLQEGSSERLQQSLLALCPREAPGETRQWTWERDTAENAQLQSMGWDCIFMGRLLTTH
ncbi:MAG TPA: hypothetical protein VE954_32590 [Oligoflexus sp.]|uniref:hypothetical protein n=1 Tax=Oligoflexus sp. TaxID=1971216 RepID=UPI002D6150F0|nr:hypothetical protein [Oligoflexus sp.]HYX37867.1 hypothetical protein [Oligoflexus sp.]